MTASACEYRKKNDLSSRRRNCCPEHAYKFRTAPDADFAQAIPILDSRIRNASRPSAPSRGRARQAGERRRRASADCPGGRRAGVEPVRAHASLERSRLIDAQTGRPLFEAVEEFLIHRGKYAATRPCGAVASHT